MKFILPLILIAHNLTAQLREPVQYTIFYEITTNRIPINTRVKGKIEIFTDSLKAFDMTWQIIGIYSAKFVHDKVIKAYYHLNYNDFRAILLVSNEDVLFILPRMFDIPMIQYPHEGKYYGEFR